MLSRHFKTFQVKCNFCMEWMSLGTQIKFSIHVCNDCLHKVCQEKSLAALSSSGEIYQIQLFGQKQMSIVDQLQIATQTILSGESIQKNETINIPLLNQRVSVPQITDDLIECNDAQIRDVKSKWNIIQSYVNQKDFLTNVETAYLKILLSQNPQNLHTTFFSEPEENFDPEVPSKYISQFSHRQNNLKTSTIQENHILAQVSNFYDVKINIKYPNHQKQQIPEKKTIKLKQRALKGKENVNIKSPVKTSFKEWDLNKKIISTCKLSELQQNFQQSTKRLNTSMFYQISSPTQSRLSSLTLPAQGSSRSAFGSSCFNSVTKRLNSQQRKRFDKIKNKILKYLEKNYDSQPLGRLMLSIVVEAYKNTAVMGKSIELVSHNLSYIDFKCYLESLDWTGIEVFKLVNTKLSDDQLKTLIDYIITNDLQIRVLVLTSNKLTEASIQALSERDLPSVKQIYLGKNHILRGKVRAQTFALQNKYSLYM